MRPQPSQPPIRQKVSTLPRQQTEASTYLDIYKLVSEKKRLQQELEQVEQRRDRILKRLEIVESQVLGLEQTAQQLRLTPKVQSPTIAAKQSSQPDTFNTFFLEY